MTNPTVTEIVEAYLREHGYDGLYDDSCCGCPVGRLGTDECEYSGYCRAGYKRKPDPDSEWADEPWIIGPEKP